MNPKTKLDLDQLVVDSFATTDAPAAPRGTVHAHDATAGCQPTPPEYADCTCNATCLCRTNAYYCATVMATVISCDYTYNDSCVYDTRTCGGESCDLPCMDTETC